MFCWWSSNITHTLYGYTINTHCTRITGSRAEIMSGICILRSVYLAIYIYIFIGRGKKQFFILYLSESVRYTRSLKLTTISFKHYYNVKNWRHIIFDIKCNILFRFKSLILLFVNVSKFKKKIFLCCLEFFVIYWQHKNTNK